MPPAPQSLALHRARHEHGRLALRATLDAARAAAISVLPVKGILTGPLFYDDVGKRPIQDIDLRVARQDLNRVERLGESRGWRLLSRSWAYETLSFEVLGFLVEFESHVGPPGLCDLQVADMIRRAERRVDPLGFEHLQPELHDHTLHMCVNVFKDKLIEASSGAVHDLGLMARAAGFDPARLVSLARATSSATIVGIVASWLAQRQPSEVWESVSRELADRRRRAVARLFAAAIGTTPPPRQLLRVLARAGADRPRDQLRAVATMALAPIGDRLASAFHLGARVRGSRP